MNETRDYLDSVIDQAIKDYPLESPPDQLLFDVQRRIQALAFRPDWRLIWLDLSFSILAAGIMGLVLHTLVSLFRSPYWAARLRVELLLGWQDLQLFLIQNQPAFLALAASISTSVLLAGILAGVYRWQTNRVRVAVNGG